MSERAPQQTHPETIRTPEAAREQLESIRKGLEQNAEKAQPLPIDTAELARRVEKQAISKSEIPRNEQFDARQHPVLVNKQLKDIAYSRTMVRVQKRLSPVSKRLSKLVHSKALDRPSELASKTLARPSSMLGGAFLAAIGTSALLWTTKHYGYEYNYLAVVLLFLSGMFLGLTLELVVRTVRRTK